MHNQLDEHSKRFWRVCTVGRTGVQERSVVLLDTLIVHWPTISLLLIYA